MLKGNSGVFKPGNKTDMFWCVNDSNLPKVLESISAADDSYTADMCVGS